MPYTGAIVPIHFGAGGILSDAPQYRIPISKLIRATNVTLYNNVLEKDYGSRQWNQTALPSGVMAFKDLWVNDTTQRVIALTRDGKVYKFKDQYHSSEITPLGTAPTALNPSGYTSILECGLEESGNPKKLFIFTGNDPVQVFSGDGTTRSNISKGASDWTGHNHPFAGIVHRGRIFAWGNRNDPSRVYISSGTDHEDFTTIPFSSSVFNGEGQRIVTGFVWKGRLLVAKYPRGIYALIDDDPDTANWYFTKLYSTFGGASPHAHVGILDDYLVGNSYGSITSVKAVNAFGDFAIADVYNLLGIKRFMKDKISLDGLSLEHALYYELKQEIYFSFRSKNSILNDRLLKISYLNPVAPEATWIEKDQPNCLGVIRDNIKADRPAYGCDDGFIYSMDQPNRWVGNAHSGSAYTMDVLTPHFDFGVLDEKVAPLEKSFDFLEVMYEPTGNWDLSIDVFCDGRFIKTILCRLDGETDLDSTLKLDSRDSLLEDGRTHQKLFPLECQGKKLAFRIYNEGNGQNVRLAKMNVYFMPLEGQQRKQ